MIRTYSRKPQACRFIEGVGGLCRLCLGLAADGVPIFADESAISALALRVMFCVGLEIKQDDGLPNLICKACCNELEHFYAFRKRCVGSQDKLKSHLLAARIRQAADTITTDYIDEKDIIVGQDQNTNVNELGLIVVDTEGNCSNKIEHEATPAISDVRSENFKIETENSAEILLQNSTTTMDPEQLSSLISSVLVKIGVLSEDGDYLTCVQNVSQIQLETADGGLVQMELVEEQEPILETGTIESAEEDTGALIIHSHVAPEPTDNDPKTKKKPRVKGGGWGCAACGRRLASRSALRRHARTHSGERPHACPDCQRRFAQKEVMLRHRLVHRDVRPYICSKCPKSFTQRNSLITHEKSHLPPTERSLALHSCPHCPKLFLYPSGLSRHIASHGGRVFECGVCHKQYSDRSAVLRHVRRARHHQPGATAPT